MAGSATAEQAKSPSGDTEYWKQRSQRAEKRARESAKALVGNYQTLYDPKIPARDLIGGLIRNPDELYQRDSAGYDRVFANPVVSEQLSTLCGPIIDAELEVKGHPDPEKNEALSTILNNIPNKSVLIESLCQSVVTGIRLVEIKWGVRLIDDKERNVPVEFLPHDHRRFAFDEFGLLWMTQDARWGMVTNRNNIVSMEGGKPELVRWGKMIAQKFRDGDGRYGYGYGLGLQLYRLVRAWDAAFEFWLDYAQSYARPWRVITTDENYNAGAQAAGIDAELEDLRDTIRYMIEDDTIALPAGVKLELLEPPSMTSADAFFTALLNKIETLIKLEITGETVTSTSDENGGGSLAKSRVADRLRLGRTRKLATGLEAALSEYLIKPIADYNRAEFGVGHQLRVEIKVPPLSPEDQLEMMSKFSGVEFLTEEVHRHLGTTMPTAEQIQNGETFTPGGNAGGDSMFGIPNGF